MKKILIIFFILISFVSEGQIKIHDLPPVPNKDSTEFIVSKIVSSIWHSYKIPIDSIQSRCYQLTVHDDSVIRWCTCDTCIDMILKGGSQLIAECAKGMDTAYKTDDSTIRFCRQDVCWEVSLGSPIDSNFANNDLTNWKGGDRYHNFKSNALTIDSTSRIHLFVDPAFGGPMKSDVDINHDYMDYQLYQPGTNQYEDIFFWPGDIYSFVEDESSNWTQIDESAKGIGLQAHDEFGYVPAKLYWSAPGVDSTADAYNFAWFDHDTLKKTTGVVQQKITNSLDIYHENVEWLTSESGGAFDPASTAFVCFGSVDIEATLPASGDYIDFHEPTSTAPDYAQYNYLTFKISSKATWTTGQKIRLRFYNEAGTSALGNVVVFSDGSYGFKSNLIDTCQLIYIPLSAFGNIVGSTRFRMFEAIFDATTNPGFYVDDIMLLQSNVPPFLGSAITWDATMRNSPDISQDYFSHFNSSIWTMDSILQLRIHVQDWVDIIGDAKEGLTDGRERMLKMHVADAPYNMMWYGNSTHVDERYSPLIGGYASGYPFPNQQGALNFRAVIDPENDYYDEDTATNAVMSFAAAVTHDRDHPDGVPLYKVYHRNAFAFGGVTPGALTEYYLQISSGGQIRLAQYPDSNYTGTAIAALGIDALGNVIKIDTSGGGGGGGGTNDRFGLEDNFFEADRSVSMGDFDIGLTGNGTQFSIRNSVNQIFAQSSASVDESISFTLGTTSTYTAQLTTTNTDISGNEYTNLDQWFPDNGSMIFTSTQTPTGGGTSWATQFQMYPGFIALAGVNQELPLFFQYLPNTETSEVLYYDHATGQVTYGAASGGGGGSADRFGLEDVTAGENRSFNANGHTFFITNISDFAVITNTSGNSLSISETSPTTNAFETDWNNGVDEAQKTFIQTFGSNDISSFYSGFPSSGGSVLVMTTENNSGSARSQMIMVKDRFIFNQSSGKYQFDAIQNFANNAAAITGGLSVGSIYRNGDVLQIVH